ncbi:hypothetical protein LSUE1_G004450 [Lachnellula suecica]|uniref:Beta-xylosidase n=1 Tax=Lachnellula suecica TaxID=602035 RepID=A0A8T9C8L0_9HELO|nr:hypothetical protein LSUE1_G004450 [Lachnellula suecica]
MWSLSLALSLLLGSALSSGAAAAAVTPSTTATFSNALSYKFDTEGNAIDSTSGKIDFLAGEYLWYGISTGCGEVFCGIKSWSSTDLKSWRPNGYLFDPTTAQITALCGGELSGNCGRPHIVYSASTKTYVLWVNAGTPGYATFTSSKSTSGYVLSSQRALVGYQPAGPYMAGDFSVEVIDGQGYIAYSLIDFTTVGASIWPPFLQSIYFQPLNAALTNTTGTVSHVVSSAGDLVDFEAESPDIFKRGDYYYISASNTCGFCTGTLFVVYRSKSITGPWTRQILSGDTCGSQLTGVLRLPTPADNNTASYLLQADSFSTAPLSGTRTAAHGHLFQLLNFNADGSIANLNCATSLTETTPIVQGTLTTDPITAKPINPTDGSDDTQPYVGTCNLPTYSLYQTWISSKTGTLTSAGLNIASEDPNGNLTLTLFRFNGTSNLLTPRYVWETLATANIVPASLSESFAIAQLSASAKVTKGDHLGLAVISGSVTPLCTLVEGGQTVTQYIENSTVPGNHLLFANGAGQVSLRGSNAQYAPVIGLGGQTAGPKAYTPPAQVSEAAPGPYAAFPIVQDVAVVVDGNNEDWSGVWYNGTQEIFGIVTWGEYGEVGLGYETSNIIDLGVFNGGVQTNCGGPDD